MRAVTCVAPCKCQRAAGEELVSKLAGDGEQARRGAWRCALLSGARAELDLRPSLRPLPLCPTRPNPRRCGRHCSVLTPRSHHPRRLIHAPLHPHPGVAFVVVRPHIARVPPASARHTLRPRRRGPRRLTPRSPQAAPPPARLPRHQRLRLRIASARKGRRLRLAIRDFRRLGRLGEPRYPAGITCSLSLRRRSSPVAGRRWSSRSTLTFEASTQKRKLRFTRPSSSAALAGPAASV
ncbi:hypothetical protein PVAP13_5KG234007 [Panicum virgatum]|uniref:Uncharacterized protein n=1 Tax=Panicum virgatum TaxID=38727 RepID=A0A8T0SGL5_PANVG|nr:hypothetical protein PVAP13_5KG234007 [Panicum virgatum]